MNLVGDKCRSIDGFDTTHENLYKVTKRSWEEFSGSDYYQFLKRKEGINSAIEEYVSNASSGLVLIAHGYQ